MQSPSYEISTLDHPKIDELNQLCLRIKDLKNSKPQQVIKLAKKALQIAENFNNTESEGYLHYELGKAYRRLENFNICLEHHKTSIQKCRQTNNVPLLVDCINGLGLAYQTMNINDAAIITFSEALEIAHEHQYIQGTATLYTNLGNIFFQLDRIGEAHKYYLKSINLTKQHCDKSFNLSGYSNLARVLKKQKKYTEAIDFYNLCIDECIKQQDYVTCSANRINLATALRAINKIDLAKETLLTAITDLNDIGLSNTNNFSAALFYMAQIMIEEKKFKQAEEYLLQCLSIDERNQSYTVLIEVYKAFYNLYKHTNKIEKALLYHEKMVTVLQKTHKSETDNTLRMVQIQFETEQKERDLNYQKKLNEKQNQLNNKLKVEIEQRQLIEKRLRKINDELAQFANVASHDLKEPVRTISAMSDLLGLRLKTEDDKIQNYIQLISGTAERMYNLLTDLINYANSQKDDEHFEQTDLNQVLQFVKDDLHEQIVNSKSNLQIGNLPTVNGIPTLLEQLFQNLISNAIKYKKPNEEASVKIYEKNNCIIIEDNGIGIPEEKLKYIFKPFNRLHHKNQIEGSGLGLATCVKIMEIHNGQIWAESDGKNGSCFSIKFN